MTRRSRGVRRPLAAACAGGALVLALSGCAGIGQPAPYDAPGINGLVVPTPEVEPRDFVDRVDNPWLALEPGRRWSFTVTDPTGEVRALVVDVLDRVVPVAGVSTTAVQTTTELRGGESTIVTDLYAQDRAGNVWLLGGDADGSGWRAGTDGAEAGLAMPADPRLGDGWLDRDVPGMPRMTTFIEEQGPDQVQVRDEAATTTRQVYEKGVGLVGVIDLDAGWTAARDD